MRFQEFEKVMSRHRMNRYLMACAGQSRKAMTLYRLNLRLSQEMFTIISCFEVALRNAIDTHYLQNLGTDWLRTAARPGGIFDHPNFPLTKSAINDAVADLGVHYTHGKLVAELGFGFWRYLFAQRQYTVCGRTLLRIFPAKPLSSTTIQYNQSFVFNQLAQINEIRNRIAHHEPICFLPGQIVKNTVFARQHYGFILQFFQWMTIDEAALLYGLDHINRVCADIDNL